MNESTDTASVYMGALEHYREAERLIASVVASRWDGTAIGIEGDACGESGTRENEVANTIAAAQVHATLALFRAEGA